MSTKHTRAAEAAERARDALQRLVDSPHDVPHFTSVEELRSFLGKITAMQVELTAGEVSGTAIGFGHRIADTWPFGSSLADLLLEAEQAYRACDDRDHH